ncbi:hypothetical protein [Halosimplex pelagicum]|uniref:PQQ-binding-like beta-propeller repeat protein n=1 Tax=Halosimplex pelagicum TaxID=869886 RepID=A0A7D5SWL4_9EURY|nr:hypothetical protein [Halosimplex pelagicum]QLH83267.1 hypothetical protein HZS54_17230 [Halosimplex pelagicum]
MPSEQFRRRFLGSLAGVASVGTAAALARSESTGDRDAADDSGPGDTDGRGGGERGTMATTAGGSPRVVWSETFGTTDDRPVGAVSAHGDGVALLISPRETDYGLRLVRFLPDGSRQWDRRLDAPEWYSGELVRADDGYVAVVRASDEERPWLLSLGSDGERRWDRYVELDDALEPNSTAAGRRPGGGVVLGGGMGEDEGRVTWVLGTDSDGDREWLRTYDTHGFRVMDVAARHDGGYLLVGESDPHAVEGTLPFVLATDESGREQWRRTLGGYAEECIGVLARPDGAVLLGRIYDHDRQEAVLSTVDDRGFPVWRRAFEGVEPRDLVDTGDGFAVAAASGLHGTDRLGRRRWDRDFEYEDLTVAAVAGDRLFVAGQVDSVGRLGGPEMWAAGVSLTTA